MKRKILSNLVGWYGLVILTTLPILLIISDATGREVVSLKTAFYLFMIFMCATEWLKRTRKEVHSSDDIR